VKVLQPFGDLPASRLVRLDKVKVNPGKPLRWDAELKAGDIPKPDVQYIDLVYYGDSSDDDEIVTLVVPKE
jgi:hypothetical protein